MLQRYVPGLDKGKGLYFLFVKSETKTPCGLLARPVHTSYYKSEHFKTRPFDPYNVYTSPNEAILCPDSFQSMYTQMLCGLLERERVLRVGAVFASGLVRAIRFLKHYWAQITHDIRTGTLKPNVTDPNIRDCMAGRLKSDPDLADFIAAQCSNDNWEGIVTRIWPNTKYLDVNVTGAMAQYIPILDYYSGGLPLACSMYASSECCFGLNLKPLCKPSEASYTIMPNMAYFEFLTHDPKSTRSGSGSPPSKLVDLAEVEVGKEYELVITTYAGLYRYRVGDIIRVTGFHNSAPQFHFVRRENLLRSIDSDKTDEAELQRAVENASRLMRVFNTSMVEYTSYADSNMIPADHVIYWELLVKDSNSLSDEVLSQCCLAMEEWLHSECYFGHNLNRMREPSEVSYTIMPNKAYSEFLPHDPKSIGSGSWSPPSKLVDLANVEVGKEYELVITTYTGLYRCRAQQNQEPIGERMIHGVFAVGDESSPAKKKYALEVTIGREVLTIDRPNKKARVEQLSITFTEEEAYEAYQSQSRNDPLVISSMIANCKIEKILVDTGSSVNILYLKAFEKINIGKDKLQADKSPLVGFTGNQITPLGSIVLPITLGEEPHQATEMVKFLVIDCPSNYNAILGRPSLNKFKAVASTYHLRIKFPTANGIGCVKGD